MAIDQYGTEWDEKDAYDCDRCEEPIYPNDEAHEVKFGFICQGCAERF